MHVIQFRDKMIEQEFWGFFVVVCLCFVFTKEFEIFENNQILELTNSVNEMKKCIRELRK